MHLENNFSYSIAGLVKAMHRIQKKLVRLFRRIKHHIEYIIADSYNLRTPLLPGLKTGVSGAEVLM
jgi:hypothetical protein